MKKYLLTFFILLLVTFCVTSCGKDEKTNTTVDKTKTIVEEYFKNYTDGNWEMVYDYLAVPESPLITRDLFVSFMSNDTELKTPLQISDYTITQTPTESEYEKKYKIEFMVEGEYTSRIMEIDLIKQVSNEDAQYKISPEKFITRNYSITVPLDSIVSIDGVLIDGLQKTSTTYEDTYLIDYLFNGQHNILIESDYLESVTSSFTAQNDGEERYTNFKITKSSLNEMNTTLINTANAIYKAAIDNKGFEAVQGLYAPDSDFNRIKPMYENLRKEIYKADGSGLKEVIFSAPELRSDYTMNYSCDDFSYAGYIKADITDSYYNADEDRIVKTKPLFSSMANNFQARYRYVDGRWQIKFLYISLFSVSADLK